MHIVVLDGYTLNPGDLDWGLLRNLGSLEVHDRTPPELVVDRARGADILLTNKTPLSRESIGQLPQLRYIGVLATGYNIIDVGFAASRGIVVTNVPAYGRRSVTQMVFALLLELTNQVGLHSARVREGAWSRSSDWCFWDKPLIELDGLTMGIVGYGAIGQEVAGLAHAFGMKVVATTRTPRERGEPEVQFVDLPTLLRMSDVVTLHCPLTADTDRLMDASRIGLMKRTAYLINTSRGGLVDEAALVAALNEERIAGAGLDVLSTEPPAADQPLLRTKNCIVTPHIAWATRAARQRLLRIATDNVRAFQRGTAVNAVN